MIRIPLKDLIVEHPEPNSFLDIFKKPNDPLNWDKHIEYAQKGLDVPTELRPLLEQSLTFLREELGIGFLKVNKALDHPLCRLITNKSPWCYDHLIELTANLRYLKNCKCNYKKVVQKLRSYNDCLKEGIPFTDIAAWYGQLGFSVSFPDEIAGQINPDLVVTDPSTNESFVIEVSQVKDSETKLLADENYQELDFFLRRTFHYSGAYYPFSCYLLECMNRKEMEALKIELTKVKETAWSHVGAMTYFRTSKIDLVICHPDSANRFQKWCDQKNRRPTSHGVPLNYDPTERILNNRKIESEARQIPAEQSGLLYFPVDPIAFLQINKEHTIRRFNEKMKAFPTLIGIVLYGYFWDPRENETTSIGHHVYNITMRNEVECRHLLFIINDSYTGKLSAQTLQNIKQSLC